MVSFHVLRLLTTNQAAVLRELSLVISDQIKTEILSHSVHFFVIYQLELWKVCTICLKEKSGTTVDRTKRRKLSITRDTG